ncbi:hypothetical protein GCM10007394_25660 [Salinibacterium amurskyense]|nr:hypothetical protein GCM10007394_25660 [Salinibacterium amurskyense]
MPNTRPFGSRKRSGALRGNPWRWRSDSNDGSDARSAGGIRKHTMSVAKRRKIIAYAVDCERDFGDIGKFRSQK